MRFPFAIVIACAALPCLDAAQSTKTHFDYRREADAAYREKNYAAALTAAKEALALRPDSPRYLYTVAVLSALTGDDAAALQHLRAAAALGIVLPVERNPDLAKFQGTPEFLRVLQLFAANREPKGEAELLAELPGTGILEGIAYRARTGDLFLGDVHHRCIWRRDRDGRVTRFTVEDEELFGIFGLAIDEERGALWAATSAVPEMDGFTDAMKGLAALVEFDLATGDVRRLVPIPDDGQAHGLGDLLIAPDGTMLASDSIAPVIWQLAPGADEVQKVIDSPALASLQGMVLFGRTLIVADYANGLVAIEVPTGNFTLLTPPPNITLLGIDGLVASPEGIIAVQNGVEPQRVLRIRLAPDRQSVTDVSVLAAALPNFTDLTLVTLVHDRPTLIAGAGWEGFDPAKAKSPPLHTVRIFQLGSETR